MPDDNALTTFKDAPPPATISQRGGMSPAMAIMLDDRLFERAKDIAKYLSRAEGFIPGHLLGKPEACFAVVVRSLTWKLDPYAVALATYQTPGGRVGFEGKLCQAILENSGKIVGPVTYEHYGDWSKVQGKYEIRKSAKGNDYAARTWDRADTIGLGVTVRAQVRGEPETRAWSFDLIQAFPLNSTLWALDPKTQICYTAVRRFASVAAPGLLMGVPFEGDLLDPVTMARDVTPIPAERPTRASVAARAAPTEPEEPTDAPDPPDMDREYRRAMGEYVDDDTGEIVEDAPATEPASAAPKPLAFIKCGLTADGRADWAGWLAQAREAVDALPSEAALDAWMGMHAALMGSLAAQSKKTADKWTEHLDARRAALAS